MTAINEFNLTLVSNTRNKFFSNTLSNFKNTFPHDFTLLRRQQDWKFALQSVSLDCKYTNIPPSLQDTKHHILCYSEEQYNQPNKENYLHSLTVENQNYSPESFKKYLNAVYQAANLEIGLLKSKTGTVLRFNKNIVYAACIVPELCELLGFETATQESVSVNGVFYYVWTITTTKLQNKSHFGILLNNQTFGKPIIPKLIKVQCSGMETIKHTAEHLYKDFAIINCSNESDNNGCHYEIKKKEYFKLNVDALDGMSVKLTDESNRQLGLLSGHPTILNLKFKKMTEKSFIIRLSSKDSEKQFPSNTSTDFSVQINPPLYFNSENWSVALTAIYHPSKIDLGSLVSSDEVWIEIQIANDVEDTQRISIAKNTVHSTVELINALNLGIEKWIGDDIYNFEYNSATENVIINVGRRLISRTSTTLAYILGQISIEQSDSDKGHIQKVYLKPARVMFTEDLRSKASLTNLIPHGMFLYCDFIDASVIGDQYAPVLKFIPLESDNSENYTEHRPLGRNFEHLNKKTLSTLSFSLRPVSGENITLLPKETSTIVSLEFKKKRYVF